MNEIGNPKQAAERLPTLFVAHGAPPLLDMRAGWASCTWARALPAARHPDDLGALGGASATLGATARAADVRLLRLPSTTTSRSTRRPARRSSPRACAGCSTQHGPCEDDPARPRPRRVRAAGRHVPQGRHARVAAVLAPLEDPKELFALGRALSPLRDEGVLIVGSGLYRQLTPRPVERPRPGRPRGPPSSTPGAQTFSRRPMWTRSWTTHGARRRLALPTHEHFAPARVALGAANGAARCSSRSAASGWAA